MESFDFMVRSAGSEANVGVTELIDSLLQSYLVFLVVCSLTTADNPLICLTVNNISN